MKTKISLIHSDKLASVDYAYASRIPSNMDLIFLAGACPLNKAGEIIHLNDYKLQARLCMDNLKEVLKECGAVLEDVVYTRVLVASQNQSDLVTAWDEVREEFGSHDIPSTLFGVTVLGYRNQLVEIEAVAAIN
jgi:enamine deaminase RidA (YjgF/YER057c/UK114 family)